MTGSDHEHHCHLTKQKIGKTSRPKSKTLLSQVEEGDSEIDDRQSAQESWRNSRCTGDRSVRPFSRKINVINSYLRRPCKKLKRKAEGKEIEEAIITTP